MPDVSLSDRRERARRQWLEVVARHLHDRQAPASQGIWSPRLECASRDELIAVQNERIECLAPYLYEHSLFYRRRFDRLGLAPTDIRTVEDLPRWPVVDKAEMAEDAAAYPPFGTYTCVDDAAWRDRGWMSFATSGSTGAPRLFRYTNHDLEMTAWANARALHAAGARRGDTVMMMVGFGPHVWAWGALMGLQRIGATIIPGGGLDAGGRLAVIRAQRPSILLCTPSYSLYLGRLAQRQGIDPAGLGVRLLFVAGEPSISVEGTRRRIEGLWGATLREFYGCTEASPHPGGYSCEASTSPGGPVSAHLAEDLAVWELMDTTTGQRVPPGVRGVTVCTNLTSEASPQLRFLVGDVTSLDETPCACGRTHVRAVPSFLGRADDVINLRGIKLHPVVIEETVRAAGGSSDDYEIVLEHDEAGMTRATVRVEHADGSANGAFASQLRQALRTRCEVRIDVEVLLPDTLEKAQVKARRVRDMRGSSGNG